MNNPAASLPTQNQLRARLRWVRLVLLWLAGAFALSVAPRSDTLLSWLKGEIRGVIVLMVLRRQRAGRAIPIRPYSNGARRQRGGGYRACVGSALRRALKARSYRRQIATLAHAARFAERLAARLAKRLAKGLRRRTPLRLADLGPGAPTPCAPAPFSAVAIADSS